MVDEVISSFSHLVDVRNPPTATWVGLVDRRTERVSSVRAGDCSSWWNAHFVQKWADTDIVISVNDRLKSDYSCVCGTDNLSPGTHIQFNCWW